MLYISIRQIYDEPSSSLLSENSLFFHMFQFWDFSVKEFDRCILFYFSCHNCTWIKHTWLVGHYCYTWLGWSPVIFRTLAWRASSEIPHIQLAPQQGEHGFDTKYMAFPGGSDGSLPAMRETRVQSLAQEDLLEKGMASHSIVLPGKSHGQRNLAGCSLWGRKELDTTERLHC